MKALDRLLFGDPRRVFEVLEGCCGHFEFSYMAPSDGVLFKTVETCILLELSVVPNKVIITIITASLKD